LADKNSFSVFKDLSDHDGDPELMRRVEGAHYDIVFIKVDYHFSLILTATASGEIGVWDFETSMLLAYLLGHSDVITEIVFLTPYPLIVTTSLGGIVCVWGIKPFDCLNRFQNEFIN
jgi:WD40 repeat protein